MPAALTPFSSSGMTKGKLLCLCGPDLYDRLKILQKADILAHSELGMERLAKLEYMSEIADGLKKSGAVYAVKDLRITGDDVISSGCPKGPEVGEILDELFAKYISGGVENERDALLRALKDIIN